MLFGQILGFTGFAVMKCNTRCFLKLHYECFITIIPMDYVILQNALHMEVNFKKFLKEFKSLFNISKFLGLEFGFKP